MCLPGLLRHWVVYTPCPQELWAVYTPGPQGHWAMCLTYLVSPLVSSFHPIISQFTGPLNAHRTPKHIDPTEAQSLAEKLDPLSKPSHSYSANEHAMSYNDQRMNGLLSTRRLMLNPHNQYSYIEIYAPYADMYVYICVSTHICVHLHIWRSDFLSCWCPLGHTHQAFWDTVGALGSSSLCC